MKIALVLLSGGQDSTTCLFWAQQQFDEVKCIGFDYGQKHKQELIQAAKIADLAGAPFKVVNIAGALLGSSLVEHGIDHNEPHSQDENLPASFTPARNALFLTIAGAYAYMLGAADIVTGVCQTDYSGYPDCRRDFIDSMEKTLSLGLDRTMSIHTPLMYLTKAETWRLAKQLHCLDIVRNYSLTDYNGDMSERNEWGYGNLDNPASILRARGYQEAKYKKWI